jgi:predicted ATPase with chaperone activity
MSYKARKILDFYVAIGKICHEQSRLTEIQVVGQDFKKALGPLLDRIDIHIEVPRVDYEKLSGNKVSESSGSIRARVQAARDIQNKRFTSGGSADIVSNADMRIGDFRKSCHLPHNR